MAEHTCKTKYLDAITKRVLKQEQPQRGVKQIQVHTGDADEGYAGDFTSFYFQKPFRVFVNIRYMDKV